METPRKGVTRIPSLPGEILKLISGIFILLSFLISSGQIPASDQDHPILIQGATVHTVSHGTLKNADIFLKGPSGWSAIDIASTFRLKIKKTLLKKGAQINLGIAKKLHSEGLKNMPNLATSEVCPHHLLLNLLMCLPNHYIVWKCFMENP